MKKNLLVLVSASLFAFSCGGGKQPSESNTPKQYEKAQGGRYYSGVFRMNETEYIKTLFPHTIVDAYSYRVANQIFEGLLKFDQSNLTITDGLAESYEVDETGTEYTFKLRKGVKFHDNPCFGEGKGRELTAEDIAYCFTQLCTASEYNLGFSIFKDVLKGANEYYNASAGGKTPGFDVEGIKVIDKYTIKLILESPSSIFKFNLAGPYGYIFAKESLEKYGRDVRVNPVGTGPFMIRDAATDIDEDIKIILTKNKEYYGVDEFGNKLPFMDAIEISFLHEKKNEMHKFKKQELDMIYRLPTDIIIDILGNESSDGDGEYLGYQLQREPEMATHFLAFLNQHSVFQDVNLRKAFSFAIDRKKILEEVLDGEGDSPGYYGVTPATFEGYDIRQINGYHLNLDSARYYLAKSDYGPGKKPFPKIHLNLNADGDRNSQVAVEVQNQLKDHLDINIDINPTQQAQHTENMMTGNTEFFRTGWLYDYPHPQNFLSAFYSKNVPSEIHAKSWPNLTRYVNHKFDKYYEMGLESDSKEAYKYFLKAEQVLMDDAPVVVLWYDEAFRLLQPYVKNFPNNPMQYRDLSEVYFDFPETVQKVE